MGRVADRGCQTADRQRAFRAEGVRLRPGSPREGGVARPEGPDRGVLGGWYWGPLGPPGPTRLGGEGQRGRGRAPDSKEGRAEKSWRGGNSGKASGVKQKVRLRLRWGPTGLEAPGAPEWSHRGPSQSPPPSHGPRGAAEGLLTGPAPRAQAPNCLPSRGLGGTPCKTRGRRGPRAGRPPGYPGTRPGADRPTDRQAGDASSRPACPPAGSFAAWRFAAPAPRPPPSPPPGAGGWGALTPGPPGSRAAPVGAGGCASAGRLLSNLGIRALRKGMQGRP